MSVKALAKAGFIYVFILIPVFVFAQQTRIYDHPDASYRLGLDLIEKKQYGAALEVFHALLHELPAGESVMRLDAQYYDALCDYKLDHPEAKQKFLQFIRYYPDHSKTKCPGKFPGSRSLFVVARTTFGVPLQNGLFISAAGRIRQSQRSLVSHSQHRVGI
jgi:tetratricopeptide (TPR) repeat protein